MTTIPASQTVDIIGNVLNAGGNALDIIGLALTTNTRVPIAALGQPVSFPTASAVSTYFGATSTEALFASVYFKAHDTKTQTPGALLFAQYPATPVSAYLRGGAVNTLTLAQLQALSGSLTVTIDGYARTGAAINLSGANSFTAAAALIQTGLNGSLSSVASVTGAIAPATSSFTGSINGNMLTVTGTVTGTIVPGTAITGTGVTATQITGQVSGTAGGAGVYTVATSQTAASTTISGAYGTLTVTVVGSGTLAIGQTLAGTGVTAGTMIWALGTGTGGTGTYFVSPSQTVASGTITAAPTPCAVAYDSVSGAFVITSGVLGTASSIGYATGTLSASLLLTSATGAVISIGAAATTPAAFMAAVINITHNWATFTHLFDPDNGVGNTQKVAFASWTNGQNNNYAYIVSDSDASPATTMPATSSLGYLIGPNGSNYSGTCAVYDPSAYNASRAYYTAFIMGFAAALDFKRTNGRTTLCFRSQSGLSATVTDATTAANLAGSPLVLGSWGNGYNYYGANATANNSFVYMARGTISGPYQWFDSYINQIWMSNAFQLALMDLLTQVNSIPYNADGYTMIENALQDEIQAAINYGAIRVGVKLSSTQATIVNNAAGKPIDQTLFNQGWYLQVLDPGAQARGNRTSPTCNFWFTDGESVQAISLPATLIQ